MRRFPHHSCFPLQGIPLNPSYLSHAVRLFSELHQRDGLSQAQDLLLQLEASATTPDSPCAAQTKELTFSLVAAIGSVLGSLKKAKVDYIHSTKCVRRRHRTCDYSNYVHHHHNILGVSSTAVSLEQLTTSSSYGSSEILPSVDPTAECKAAVVGEFLLELYTVAETRMLQMRALSAVDQYGLCCCMHPQQILSALLPGLEGHKPGIRNYVLCVLTKALMEHCGGSKTVQRATVCQLCKDHPRSSLEAREARWSGIQMKDIPPLKDEHDSCDNDSALSSSEASTHEEVMGPAPRWHCLQHLVPLIVASPEAISVQVTQHLLRLVSQAGPVVRHEIFTLIFLPLLQAIQNTYPLKQPRSSSNASSETLRDQPASSTPTQPPGSPVLCETVVHYILAALPLLLETRESQELFLDRSGLNQLLALFHVPSFRRCVLSVFQVLIVLEDQRSQAAPETSKQAEDQHLSDSGSEEDNRSYWFNVIDTFMSIVEEEGLNRTRSGAMDKPLTSQPTPGQDERTTHVTPGDQDSHMDSNQNETNPSEPDLCLAIEQYDEEATEPTDDTVSNLNQTPDTMRTKDPDGDIVMSEPSHSNDVQSTSYCDNPTIPFAVIPEDLSDLSVVCDVWVTCSRLYPCSKLFQAQLALHAGVEHAGALLRLVLDRICAADDGVAADCMSGHQPANQLTSWLSLAESCLLLCLASFNTDSKRHKQVSNA